MIGFLKRLKPFGQVGMPFVVMAVCFWLLSQQVSSDLWQSLPAFFGTISLSQWTGAAAFTLVSLYAVGRYDGVAHSHLRTGVSAEQARLSGMAAISVAQTLGFGLLTGALARWRLLQSLSLGKALSVSAFVSLSFVVAWGVVTAIACVLLPAPDWTFWLALPVVLAIPLAGAVMFWWPEVRVRHLRMRLPSLRHTSAILIWSLVDTAAAAAALWLLLPEGATLGFIALMPLYLIALGAALISNTPGGVGPFELILIGALPQLPAEVVLHSIIAFRLVYYAVPACLGALSLIKPFATEDAPAFKPARTIDLRHAPRSETYVAAQNGGMLADTRDGTVAFWPTSQALTALFAPVSGSTGALLAKLCDTAKDLGKVAVFYKCSAQDASLAKRLGWSVLRIADDAMISTEDFRLDTPRRRTLRRKIRTARKAGVQVYTPANLPVPELARVDAEWCERHGPARGGTMGRYDLDYVSQQWVAVAEVHGRAVAFVSVFCGPQEWTLDLMRQTEDAPDGTMHALTTHAIEAALAAGVGRFSLAATPACPNPQSAIWRFIAQKVVAGAGGPGLRQFKSNFDPVWVPRYACAPNAFALAIGLGDIARHVHHPAPLPTQISNPAHENDENYEIALKKSA